MHVVVIITRKIPQIVESLIRCYSKGLFFDPQEVSGVLMKIFPSLFFVYEALPECGDLDA